MAGPRLERIRPCHRCGALMPFSALRCGACGTPASGAALQDERVRPCLECGVILRFDQDPCPQCGARAKSDEDEGRIKPCAACGELIPFEPHYCPRCGQFAIPIPVDSIPPDVALDVRSRWIDFLPTCIGGAAFAAGIVALAVAAVELID